MKNFSQIRVLGFRLLGMAAVWSCCCTSCSKDPTAQIGGGSSAHLAFTVDEGGAWTSPRSRSAADTTARITIFRLEGTQPGDSLFLHAAVADRPDSTLVTRGTCIDNDSFYDAFGVLAFVYTGAWSDDLTPDYMYDVEITKASGWTASEYNWPGKGRMIRFFAYAPYHGTGIQLSEKQTPGAPTITYTTPADVAQQQDLVAAAPAEMDGAPAPEKSAALNFSHILTAIRFSVGDDMMAGRITKITLKDVYGKAVYDMGTGTWSGFSTSESFSQTLSEDVDGTPDVEITAPEATFLMIPQTLPQGATIEIAYTDQLTGTSRTLTAGIGNSVWPKGQTVTYRISTSSIKVTSVLSVTGPEDFTYQGGSGTYGITSYRVVNFSGGEQITQPVAWTAEFSTDEGLHWTSEKPSWLSAFTTEGVGSTTSEELTATIKNQTKSESSPHDDILQLAAPISGIYDLSTKGGTTAMNTANCYVINAPGKYSLPLVYGNAIKDGQTNESAYTSSASGAYVLKNFVNHRDAAITDPYIYNNAGCTPNNATLVWQDEENLVTNIALTDDKQHLTFEVPQATIRQGNAIVAVRNGANQIMWSWHIWVTDYVPGLEPTVEMTYDPTKTPRDKVVTNYQDVQYTFMGVNLGWCDLGSTVYEPREVLIRIRQKESNKTATFTIRQLKYSVSKKGTNTYYQLGRKDPLLPAEGNKDKSCYYTDSKFDFQYVSSKVTIATAIQNPNIMYGPTDRNWCANDYLNLWDVNGSSDPPSNEFTEKTIYDPSPVGYCLPTYFAFLGTTYAGANASDYKLINSYYDENRNTEFSQNFGYILYCNKMLGEGIHDTSGGVFFIPATGSRDAGGNPTVYVKNCRLISSSCKFYNLETQGYWFNGMSSAIQLTNTHPYGFVGNPVRPVCEK